MLPILVNAQCTEFNTGPYIDYDNTFGAAPCLEDCADGPNTITAFQVWTNESYIVADLEPGAEYTVSICEGYTPNNWEAELTVMEYDNEANEPVPGTVMGNIVDCSLTFTVPTSYTEPVTIIALIIDNNDCGGVTQQIDNGFFSFGCSSLEGNGQQPCPAPILCNDPTVSLGNPTVSSISVCEPDTLFLNFDETTVFPTEGDVFGATWAIGTGEITNTNVPNEDPNFVQGFQLLPATDVRFIYPATSLGAIPPGGTTIYFTPIIAGNATNTTGEADFLENMTLDPDCTLTGQSVAVTFYSLGDVVCGCPEIAYEPISCDGGTYTISFTVLSLGNYNSFDITDNQNTITVTATGVYEFPATYTENEETTLFVVTPDGGCSLNETFSGACPADCNVVSDPSFELSNGAWSESTALCDASCGADVAADGNFWLWFGGFQDGSVDEIEQTVTIPEGNAILSFLLLLGGDANAGNNTLSVSIDGLEISNFSDLDAEDFAAYNNVTIDISAFADGGEHIIKFVGTTVDLFSFHVDFVQVDACGVQCLPDAGTLSLVNATETGFTVAANNQQTSSEYLYFYVATAVDNDQIIGDFNFNGTFTLSGEYNVYGISVALNDAATIQSATSITDINALINTLGTCASVSESITVTATSIESGYEDWALEQVSLTPNNTLVVELNSLKAEDLQVNIMDITGKLFMTKSFTAVVGSNNLSFDMSAYPSGIYLFNLTNHQQTLTSKFVKN